MTNGTMPPGGGIDEESAVRQANQAAKDQGLDIEGKSTVEHRGPDRMDIKVRLDENGNPLPPRGKDPENRPAASILIISITHAPVVGGDLGVQWTATAEVIDVETTEVPAIEISGDNRATSPGSIEQAVSQVLQPLVRDGKVVPPPLPEPPSQPVPPSSPLPVPLWVLIAVGIALVIGGFFVFGGGDDGEPTAAGTPTPTSTYTGTPAAPPAPYVISPLAKIPGDWAGECSVPITFVFKMKVVEGEPPAGDALVEAKGPGIAGTHTIPDFGEGTNELTLDASVTSKQRNYTAELVSIGGEPVAENASFGGPPVARYGLSSGLC